MWCTKISLRVLRGSADSRFPWTGLQRHPAGCRGPRALRFPRDDDGVLTARIAGDADQSLLQADRFRDREVSADERGDLLEAVFALVHVGDRDVPLRVLR